MAVNVEIVTPERSLFSGEVNMVTLPGSDGQMGILGNHAPMLTTLDVGEIVLHQQSGEFHLAVSGGIAEIRPNKVTILADTAEDPDEIDVERAEAARARAQQSLEGNPPAEHRPVLLSALRRSNLRLKVAQRRRSSAAFTGGDNK